MHKINRDEAQMLTDSSKLWGPDAADAECSFRGSLAGPRSLLQVRLPPERRDAKQTPTLYSLSVFPRKREKFSSDFLRLAKPSTNADLKSEASFWKKENF